MLTIQDKLDQIAREREVLALRQALARLGLREGDTVGHVESAIRGRLVVKRGTGPPAAVVRTDAGTEEPYAEGQWVLVQPQPRR